MGTGVFEELPKEYGFSGDLVLPAYEEWKKIFSHEWILQRFGRKADALECERWLSQLFHMNSSGNVHAAVHRVASLPVLATAQPLFRVRRKTVTQGSVYQLISAVLKYKGFASEGGVVDWKRPLVFDALVHADLTPLERPFLSSGEVTSMNEWRLLSKDEQVEVKMSPATMPRPRVEVLLPFEMFGFLLKEGGMKVPSNPLMLKGEYKLKDMKKWPEKLEGRLSILTLPRGGNIFLTKVGRRVGFVFDVDHTRDSMKDAFNNAA